MEPRIILVAVLAAMAVALAASKIVGASDFSVS